MTRRTFYKYFRKIAKNHKWSVDINGVIRTEIEGEKVCPINAVYYHKTGKVLWDTKVNIAGNGMMAKPDWQTIMCGADNERPNWIDHLTPQGVNGARRALLRACNL